MIQDSTFLTKQFLKIIMKLVSSALITMEVIEMIHRLDSNENNFQTSTSKKNCDSHHGGDSQRKKRFH